MKWTLTFLVTAVSLSSHTPTTTASPSSPEHYTSSPQLQHLQQRQHAPHYFQGRRPKGLKTHSHPDIQRVGNGTFTQSLDHIHIDSNETFEQRYWWDAASWKGEGSPIFLFNPGETDADEMVGYLSNETLPGMLADLYGGAVVLLEHRYFGKSIPFRELSAETLQHLNLPNSISDNINFAQNVVLPFDEHNHTHPSVTPWVLIGGSYSGALAAWTQKLAPGTFWSYHASSAVLQAIYDFDEYFDPIEKALPRNCSADIKAVVAYIDDILSRSSDEQVQELKDMFGLPDLEHHDDFAELITIPIWKWQNEPWLVYDFCDFIEGKGEVRASVIGEEDAPDEEEKKERMKMVKRRLGEAKREREISEMRKAKRDDGDEEGDGNGEEGVGLANALPAYAQWVNETVGPMCRLYNCDTYSNPEGFNQPYADDGDRQWDWLLCNEPFAFWQVGPSQPTGNSIVSSHLNTSHWQRRCDLWFPPTNDFMTGSSLGYTVDHENTYTGGWNASFSRVSFVDGEYDPWIGATLNSPHQPGGARESEDDMPIWVIEAGNHVPDLVVDEMDEREVRVAEEVYEVHGRWLREWYEEKGRKEGD